MSKFQNNNNNSNTKLSTKEITISGLLLSLALVFSNIKLVQMPSGGSITVISLILVTLVGYLFGAKVGFIASFAYGLLQLIMGGYVIHPIQLLFDYPIAFLCLGLSGIFRNKQNGLIWGYLLGCLAKYFCHVFTGVVFFSEVGATFKSSLIYSLTYNLYIVPEVVITLILIPLILPQINKLKISRI